MAFSSVTYVSAGEATYTVTFPYLSQSHVKLYVNGAEDTTFTWDSATVARPTTTPVAGDIVLIERTSSQGTRIVDHQDASVLTEATLDADALQMFYMAQEALDDAAAPFGVRVAYGTVSNAATLTLNAAQLPTTYDFFKLYINELTPVTDGADLYIQVSVNDGVLWKNGASDYEWNANALEGTPVHEEDTADAQIKVNPVARGFSNTAAEGAFLEITIQGIHSATARTSFTVHGGYSSDASALQVLHSAAQRLADEANNAIKLYFSAGNISEMRWTLVGYKLS